jgi:hypothetical protein
MTTLASPPSLVDADTATVTDATTDTVVFDGAPFFQPPPATDELERNAHAAVDVTLTLPLDALDSDRLTGVSRTLVEAAIETRLRHALYAAGYRNISRRIDTAAVVLDARH